MWWYEFASHTRFLVAVMLLFDVGLQVGHTVAAARAMGAEEEPYAQVSHPMTIQVHALAEGPRAEVAVERPRRGVSAEVGMQAGGPLVRPITVRAAERCAGAVGSHVSAEGAGKGKGRKADGTLEITLLCMHW